MGEKVTEPYFSPVQIDLMSQYAHRDPQVLTIPAWTTGLRKSFVSSQLKQQAAEELLVQEMYFLWKAIKVANLKNAEK